MKTEFHVKWKNLIEKLAYQNEYLNGFDDYQKTVNFFKKEEFFKKLKTVYTNDLKMEKTKEIIKIFIIKGGEKLTKSHLKIKVTLLTCVFEKFLEVSINEFDVNLLYSVTLSGHDWQCSLEYTDFRLQALQDKHLILQLEKIS